MLAFLRYLFTTLFLLFVVALVTSSGRRLLVHCVRVLLNGKSPLRWLVGLLAGVLPPVCWTLAFKLARNLPSEWRPTIHTHLLPVFEMALLSPSGIIFLTLLLSPWAVLVRIRSRNKTGRVLYPLLIVLFPTWLKVMNKVALGTTWTPFQDVFAWIFYGVLHFASPFLAGWWIWGFGPPGAAIVYGITLGVQNMSGLLTHIIFPNAAPWYYDVYPTATVPDYDFPGNPAGLVRVDVALGTHLYRAAFKKSPVVFGALPSLHAASATCFSFFVARYGGKWGHIVMFFYSTFMFWSTQYLHHHFAVDLLVGTLYSVIAFHGACIFLRRLEAKHEREATTRGVDRLFCWPSPYAAKDGPRSRGLGNGNDEESWDMAQLSKGGSGSQAGNGTAGRGKKVRFWTSSSARADERDDDDEEKAMLSGGEASNASSSSASSSPSSSGPSSYDEPPAPAAAAGKGTPVSGPPQAQPLPSFVLEAADDADVEDVPGGRQNGHKGARED